MTTYLDIKYPGPGEDEPSWGPDEHVEWWRQEAARWQEMYANLSDEIGSLNPFADPAHAEALRNELAAVADNLSEATGELLGWLDTETELARGAA